jgi:hypothetical protein
MWFLSDKPKSIPPKIRPSALPFCLLATANLLVFSVSLLLMINPLAKGSDLAAIRSFGPTVISPVEAANPSSSMAATPEKG